MLIVNTARRVGGTNATHLHQSALGAIASFQVIQGNVQVPDSFVMPSTGALTILLHKGRHNIYHEFFPFYFPCIIMARTLLFSNWREVSYHI